MKSIPLLLAGMLLAPAALAHGAPAPDAPPPPASAVAGTELQPPPPPPGGPRGERPPPPPPGAAVMIDRRADGTVHVDVHCARADTTKDCADIASRLFAETGAAAAGK